MLKFNFLIPLAYAIIFTYQVFKNHLFDLGLNTLTLGLYIIAIGTIFTLRLMGRMIDKCLERWF